MQEKFKMIASVYLLFKNENNILLLRRCNTGYEDGNYGLVAGHVDINESLRAAAVREAKEESGVDIDSNDLALKAIMHRRQNDERLDFFFEPRKWIGDPINMEPDKCDELRWFPLDDIPQNTIPYIRQVINSSSNGVLYSEFGW